MISGCQMLCGLICAISAKGHWEDQSIFMLHPEYSHLSTR